MSHSQLIPMAELRCRQTSDTFFARRCNGRVAPATDLSLRNWFRCQRCQALYFLDDDHAAWGPYRYPIDHDMARRRLGQRLPGDPSFLSKIGTGLCLLLLLIVVVPAALGTVAQLLLGTAISPLVYTAYPLKLFGIDGLTNQLLVSWAVIFAVLILSILRKRSRNSLQTSPDSSDPKRDPQL